MLIKLADSKYYKDLRRIAKAGTSFAGNWRKKKHHITDTAINAGISGAAIGGFAGIRYRVTANQGEKKENRKSVGKAALKGMLIGGTIGAGIGAAAGHADATRFRHIDAESKAAKFNSRRSEKRFKDAFGEDFDSFRNKRRDSPPGDDFDFFRRRSSYGGGFTPPPPRPSPSPGGYTPPPRPPRPTGSTDANMFHQKGFTTKKDAKSFYRKLAQQHHPDAGGDAEIFKKVSTQWTDYQPHFEKLAQWLNKKMIKGVIEPAATTTANLEVKPCLSK